jgi:hypothetical protein
MARPALRHFWRKRFAVSNLLLFTAEKSDESYYRKRTPDFA